MVRVSINRTAVVAGSLALSFVVFATAATRADAPPAHELAERFADDAARTERKAAERAEHLRLRQLEAERQRDERDMLDRARAEASERQADLERQRIARELAERLAEEEAQLIAEAKRAEETRRQAEAAARAEAEKQATLVREREADAARLSDVLREAAEVHERRRQERRANALATPPPVLERAPSPPVAARETPAGPEIVQGETDRKFAVLLVMEPGNRGIRRHNKTADPVLCTDDGCYVSNGPAEAATLLPRNKALGFGRTWGARAGACQNTLGCVFRGVDAANLPIHLQPVDMRLIRHDRRETQRIEAGSDCFVVAARLSCRRPVRASDYVMWLVPERLVAKVGPEMLEKALADGLADGEQAALRGVSGR